MFDQQLMPAQQDRTALLGGLAAPWTPGVIGRRNRRLGLNLPKIGYIGQMCASRRVGHRKLRLPSHPFAIDQRLRAQQAGVFQCVQRGFLSWHCVFSEKVIESWSPL